MRIAKITEAPQELTAEAVLGYAAAKVIPGAGRVNINSAKIRKFNAAFNELDEKVKENYQQLDEIGKKAVMEAIAGKMQAFSKRSSIRIERDGGRTFLDLGMHHIPRGIRRKSNHISFMAKRHEVADAVEKMDIGGIIEGQLEYSAKGQPADLNTLNEVYDNALGAIQSHINGAVDALKRLAPGVKIQDKTLDNLKRNPANVSNITVHFADQDISHKKTLGQIPRRNLSQVEILATMVQDLSVAKNKIEGAKKLGVASIRPGETAEQTAMGITTQIFSELNSKKEPLAKKAATGHDLDRLNESREEGKKLPEEACEFARTAYSDDRRLAALEQIERHFITPQEMGLNVAPVDIAPFKQEIQQRIEDKSVSAQDLRDSHDNSEIVIVSGDELSSPKASPVRDTVEIASSGKSSDSDRQDIAHSVERQDSPEVSSEEEVVEIIDEVSYAPAAVGEEDELPFGDGIGDLYKETVAQPVVEALPEAVVELLSEQDKIEHRIADSGEALYRNLTAYGNTPVAGKLEQAEKIAASAQALSAILAEHPGTQAERNLDAMAQHFGNATIQAFTQTLQDGMRDRALKDITTAYVEAHFEVVQAAPADRDTIKARSGFNGIRQTVEKARAQSPAHLAWKEMDEGIKLNQKAALASLGGKQSQAEMAGSLAHELGVLKGIGLKSVLKPAGVDLEKLEEQRLQAARERTQKERTGEGHSNPVLAEMLQKNKPGALKPTGVDLAGREEQRLQDTGKQIQEEKKAKEAEKAVVAPVVSEKPAGRQGVSRPVVFVPYKEGGLVSLKQTGVDLTAFEKSQRHEVNAQNPWANVLKKRSPAVTPKPEDSLLSEEVRKAAREAAERDLKIEDARKRVEMLEAVERRVLENSSTLLGKPLIHGVNVQKYAPHKLEGREWGNIPSMNIPPITTGPGNGRG